MIDQFPDGLRFCGIVSRALSVASGKIYVDVTTGPRLHPGDFMVREFLSLVVAIVMVALLGYYMFCRFATIFFAYFSHSNISMHQWHDKLMNYVIITPEMHNFHLHFERPWTDTNFKNIFSISDCLFGTFVYCDTSKIHYGLDAADNTKYEEIAFQFKLPFDKNIRKHY